MHVKDHYVIPVKATCLKLAHQSLWATGRAGFTAREQGTEELARQLKAVMDHVEISTFLARAGVVSGGILA